MDFDKKKVKIKDIEFDLLDKDAALILAIQEFTEQLKRLNMKWGT